MINSFTVTAIFSLFAGALFGVSFSPYITLALTIMVGILTFIFLPTDTTSSGTSQSYRIWVMTGFFTFVGIALGILFLHH